MPSSVNAIAILWHMHGRCNAELYGWIFVRWCRKIAKRTKWRLLKPGLPRCTTTRMDRRNRAIWTMLALSLILIFDFLYPLLNDTVSINCVKTLVPYVKLHWPRHWYHTKQVHNLMCAFNVCKHLIIRAYSSGLNIAPRHGTVFSNTWTLVKCKYIMCVILCVSFMF